MQAMTRELPQKRSVGANTTSAGEATASAVSAASGIRMPPKKRPRLPDADDIPVPAPLDLSAKASSPSQLVAAPAALPVTASMMAATADYPWRAAAAAAMYAHYMTYLTSMAMPMAQTFLPQSLPPLPQQPPLPPPPPPPLALKPSPLSTTTSGAGGGETDFRCSCGSSYGSLIGLTLHLKSAGHSASAATPSAAVAAVAAAAAAKELPKLVRGQDMWINSETEQTREILRCMRCGQSYSTLPELTMHMVRSRHYAEIIYSSDGTARASAASPRRRRSSQSSQPRPASSSTQIQQAVTAVAAVSPPELRKPAVRHPANSGRSGAPAYLSPNLPSVAGRASLADNPLSCLQRLVNETSAPSADYFMAAAAASAAAIASPSVTSCASTSSTSDAASVTAAAAEETRSAPSSAAPTPPPPPPPPPQQQPQPVSRPQPQLLPKKAKCQYCGKPFANKGQVRLHVSKGKCPAVAGSGLSDCFQRHGGFAPPGVASAAAASEPWELPAT